MRSLTTPPSPAASIPQGARGSARCGRRALALVQAALLVWATSCDLNPPLAPRAGLLEYQAHSIFAVPGALVNVAGGNLILRRRDLSIDTRIGELALGAVYNSSAGQWQWSFEMHYDGERFLDATGALFDVSELAAGDAIAGSRWLLRGSDSIQTKGGLVHEFDAGGRLQVIRWSSALYPRVHFLAESVAGADRTTAIEQCRAAGQCEPVYEITYDAQGRVAAFDDRAGRRAEFTYDASGRLVAARDALDVARGWPGFRYEYDASLLSAVTNSEGERVEYRYLGRRVKRVEARGEQNPVYAFLYGVTTSQGLYFTLVRDPRGYTQVFRYDADARVHEHEDANGARRSWSWEGLRPVAHVDAEGVTTRWSWSQDRLLGTTLPSGNVLEYRYEDLAVNRREPDAPALLELRDSLGLVEQRSYDAQGRVVSRTNGAGDRFEFTYDDDQNLSSVVDPAGIETRMRDYGADGHARLRERGSVSEARAFDAVGNLVRGLSIASPYAPGRPGIVSRSYDEDRNLSGLELSSQYHLFLESSMLEIEHRSDGRPLRIARPHGGDAEFLYDALGRLRERREWVDGSWASVVFEYDAAGNPLATLLPNGVRREIFYDEVDRPLVLRHWRDGAIEREVVQFWGGARLASRHLSGPGGFEYFDYDSAGRLVGRSFPNGEREDREYDLRSREIRRVLSPAGGSALVELERGYDEAGREQSLLLDGQPLLLRSYGSGRLERIDYGNGLERSFEYGEELGVLVATSTRDASGVLLASTSHSDESCIFPGQMICSTWTTETHGGVSQVSIESYLIGPLEEADVPFADSGPRVVAWAGGGDPAGYDGNPFYEYDALGNLSGIGSVLDVSQTLSFNEQRNRLLSGGGHSYRYDAAGYVLERDGVPLSWTAGGQIASFGDDRFEWDLFGRPLSSTLAGVERRYRYGGQVLADARGGPIGIDLGEVSIELASGARHYRHFDFRGNVKFVTDESGDVVDLFHYAPYGVDERYGAGTETRSFAQGLEVGDLVLLGGRLYDPDVARFLAPDPVFHLINQYAYTMGNPAWLWDPLGAIAIPVPSGAGESLIALGNTLLNSGLGAQNAALAIAGAVLIGLGFVLRAIEGTGISAVPIGGSPPEAHGPTIPGLPNGGGGPSGGGGGPGGGGGGAGPGGGEAGAAAGGCAPAALTRGLAGPAQALLPVLVAAQLLLAIALLLARARGRKARVQAVRSRVAPTASLRRLPSPSRRDRPAS